MSTAKRDQARAAALAAAEARLKAPTSPSGEASSSSTSTPAPRPEPVWVKPSEKQDDDTRRNFARMLDRGIVRDNGYKESAEAVETLLKIANNILANAEEPKYRDIKATNPTLQHKILSVKGGHDYLILLGFRTATKDFVKHYVLQRTMQRLHELQIGAEVLQAHLTSLQSRASSQASSTAYARSEEAARKARALAEIDADRDLVRSRVDRERLTRQYREEAARARAELAAQHAGEEEGNGQVAVSPPPIDAAGGHILGGPMTSGSDKMDQDVKGGSATAGEEGTTVGPDSKYMMTGDEHENEEDDEDEEDGTYDAFSSGGRRLGE